MRVFIPWLGILDIIRGGAAQLCLLIYNIYIGPINYSCIPQKPELASLSTKLAI